MKTNGMRPYTIQDFNRDFPDDDSCLEWLRQYLYPEGIFCKVCQKITKHHRVRSRPSYSCDWCGHHVHPTADTIFEKSTTPLRLWFYAVHLMASTRCGISAKQIQRETGVTYKTAWRMFSKIRELLAEPITLSGSVEVDETYIGARKAGKRGRGAAGKMIAIGAAERKGRVVAIRAPDVKAQTIKPFIKARVLPATVVYTDEMASYDGLPAMGYHHRRIHHETQVYVRGDVHTNTIEGFWSLLKRGISGVYHAVSEKYLQSYLNEYAFRYNHRNDEQSMFRTILGQISKADAD
jgi:transposase-like protein